MAGNTMYLHGDLDLRILEARCLPEIKPLSDCLRTGPKVVVCLGTARLARTTACTADPQNPVWNEHFSIPLAHPVSDHEETNLLFKIRDKTLISKQIGLAAVQVDRIASGEKIDDWFPIIGKVPQSDAWIRLQISFRPCSANSGISENYETTESYFPLRHGGDVTLYQDAHVLDGSLPEVRLDMGRIYKHGQCWHDISRAILGAKRLIYITGWSFYHKIKLVREPTNLVPSGSNSTLGELLKRKASEGVRVVLLVWNDPTSLDKFHIRTKGKMETHDEETRRFFKNSPVTCVLTSRPMSRILYSHHQKSVIVDTSGHGGHRKITTFLGGLDLCDARYDTPEHRLFRDLDTVFHEDFHNPIYTRGEQCAPREPWHDLHCRIEGPAAFDVLTNFEQRWAKATESFRHDDVALIDIENDPLIISPSPTIPNDHRSLWASDEHDPKRWHVQIFRSIDSDSLEGFPTDVYSAEEQNLVWEKNKAVDRSIQNAHIQAIRSAQHFIYIENQYFVGSSFAWPIYKDSGADNLIPMEVALKIASKIKAGEKFSVYIVIPMWPEGKPDASPAQDILYWQRQTMQMMYNVVAQEIKAARLEGAHPTDYLNFYCLGSREEDSNAGAETSSGVKESASQKFGRFMVYVHSKGMIVDDAYVLLGSANINERSMSGRRDTEIAMGAYQPHHTWPKKNKHPRGQVYGYRMSLWAEHIGSVDDCFNNPENLECVKYVNDAAENNWTRYTAKSYTQLQGHILKYPVEVDVNGEVKPLPGYENFPDVGGEVQGSLCYYYPPSVTT